MASTGGRLNGTGSGYAAPISLEDRVLEDVEDLFRAYGIKSVVAACLRSSHGSEFTENKESNRRVAIWILRQIAFSKNPRLEAEVMALGAGLMREDKATMTAVAKKFGISKQAISKRVIKFCEENGFRPSGFMRPLKDRRTYSLTNQPREA